MMTTSQGSASDQDVVAAFHKEGYRILFTGDLGPIPSQPREKRRLQPDALRIKPGQGTGPIEHRPPRVPLTIDGKDVDGEQIMEHNGRPLHFAVQPEGDHGSRLHAFTNMDEANEFIIANVVEAEPADEDPHGFFGSHVQPAHPVRFFEHVGCQGSSISLDYRHAFWDLREHWMSGILWWWTSWNDQISSLATTGRGVRLYEHIHWGGSSLYFGSNRLIWSLVDYGWNDRVSSVETTF